MLGKKTANAFAYIALSVGALVILLPMYLTVIVAFKSPEMTAKNFFMPPTTLYLENFKQVFAASNFWNFVGNSVLITFLSLAGIAFITPLVSYSVSRNMDRRYYRVLYYLLVSGTFIPFTVLMVPQIKLMSSLNATNKWGLILLYWTFGLSEGTLLCTGYINGVPKDLEEAAYIDGAGVLYTFIKVIYPIITPIIVALMIMDALWIWNDFQLPLLMLNARESLWTLPLFQYNFRSKYTVDYNLAFAAFLLSTLPIMIAYLIAQKQIVNGLTAGAIKA